MQELSHVNAAGEVQMVDISGKAASHRAATAAARVRMQPETLAKIEAGDAPKGDVFATVKLAGIMAAKQTAQLIPLCHPLPLHKLEIEIQAEPDLPGYTIRATAATKAETGVEMEALTAATVAALTLYDMAKAIDKGIAIENVRLLQKTGGQSGDYVAGEHSAGG